MHNALAPSWLVVWQAAASLLDVATRAATVLPVMALLALLFGRRRLRAGMAAAGRLFLDVGLVTGLLGALHIAGDGFVSIWALPSSMPNLEPAPWSVFSLPWRATNCAFVAWAVGLIYVLASRWFARPVFTAAGFETDEDTRRRFDRLSLVAGLLAAAATAFFFASLVVRHWPFLGLPEQMSEETVLRVLLKYNWRECCAALMPAGGLCVFTFFLRQPRVSPELRAKDWEQRKKAIIPGSVEEVAPFTENEIACVRMAAAFALAGAAFQLLDAAYLAFNSAAALQGYSIFMRLGPFIVTAGSLVCWAFIFSKPRRRQMVLALLPVLLILLRAVGGF